MDIIPKNPLLEFLPDARAAIRKIYNLDNGRNEQSLDILEHWLQKQGHFVNKNYSRQYLDTTLVCCKGSVEKSKSQLDKLCTFKTLLPKFFIGADIKETFDNIQDISYVIPLPKMTKNYERIFVCKINSNELTSSNFLDYYRQVIAIAEYLKEHDFVNGYLVILDYRDANLMDLVTKLSAVELHQFMTIMIEGYGAILRGIHIITPAKIIDMLVKMLKAVLSEKLGERIHVHRELEGIYQYIDRDVLPADLGGKERSLKAFQDNLKEVLCSPENQKFLARMKASVTEENRRQTDEFKNQCLGLPGSFRTLTVD